MPERLLFVPGFGMSPRCCEDVPAVHAVLDSFREHFNVSVFHWPTARGGPVKPLTWQGAAEAIGEVLPSDGHVVAIRANVTYALPALAQHPNLVRSLVCDGFEVPTATWVALGMPERAGAIEASMRLDAKPAQFAHLFFPGADEAIVQEIVERMYADSNLTAVEEFAHQNETLNLVEVQPQLSVPALYIRSEMPYPGWAERGELFQRFVPNTEFVEMEPWRFHEPESGRAFAELAIPFMQKHSARTVLATVLIADIVDSTVHATTLGDRRWSQLLGQFHGLVERELTRSRGKLIDTAGDGFLAVFDDPASAIDCAWRVATAARELGLETRAGIHTGQTEVADEKYSGIAVHTAARVAAKAAPGEVLVSETVRQLLAGSEIAFEDRGRQDLKGLTAAVRLYSADLK